MMKRLLLVTAILLSLFCMVSCVESPPELDENSQLPQAQTFESSSLIKAQVTRVIDGDTIEVNIDGNVYRVRYIGIDTPEMGEPGYDEATQANYDLVYGRIVDLEKDISETDRYGRLLRYVWAGNEMINAKLVIMGYAQVTTYPPDVKYQDELLTLQEQACAAGLGLWSDAESETQKELLYVGSINSNKYHYPACRYAKQIYPENEIWFSSASEALSLGYVPCKGCNPPVTD